MTEQVGRIVAGSHSRTGLARGDSALRCEMFGPSGRFCWPTIPELFVDGTALGRNGKHLLFWSRHEPGWSSFALAFACIVLALPRAAAENPEQLVPYRQSVAGTLGMQGIGVAERSARFSRGRSHANPSAVQPECVRHRGSGSEATPGEFLTETQ
jgi:hypothetical protein